MDNNQILLLLREDKRSTNMKDPEPQLIAEAIAAFALNNRTRERELHLPLRDSIMLPCLTVVSSACGILAGGAFMRLATDTAFGVYFSGVTHSIVLSDVMTGLLKSLAFAAIIVNVGCLEGLRVRGGPDSVGRSATSAVVKSTFLVILADVVFTTVFYLTGGH